MIVNSDDAPFSPVATEGYCAGIPVVVIRAKDAAALLASGTSSCLRPCMTAEQARLKSRVFDLQDARDWQGMVALATEALALARDVQGANLDLAGAIYSILGVGFQNVGQYAQARDMYEQHKVICEALGDRAGMAAACGNLGLCYDSTGDYGRVRNA